MVKTDEQYVLFIEPLRPADAEPLADSLSQGMREAMDQAVRPDHFYFGFHTCVCGAKSDPTDWILPSGQTTNSLAVHYLEYHRSEVPRGEIEKVERICSEVERLRPIWDKERETRLAERQIAGSRVVSGSCETFGTSFLGEAESYCPICGGVVCPCGGCFCGPGLTA